MQIPDNATGYECSATISNTWLISMSAWTNNQCLDLALQQDLISLPFNKPKIDNRTNP